MRLRAGDFRQAILSAVARLGRWLRAHGGIATPCFAAATMLSLLCWAVLLRGVALEREAGVRASLDQAEAMARAYAEQVARTLTAHDLVLRQLREGWLLTGGALALDSARAAQLYRDAPYANLAILDKNGALLSAMKPGRLALNGAPAASQPESQAASQAASQAESQAAYFRRHARAAADLLELSAVDDGAGHPALQLSRAIRAGDGRFDGVALIQLSAAELTTSFLMHPGAPGALLGLARLDGRVLLAASGAGAGTSFVLPAPAIRGAGTGGSVEAAAGAADGRARYLGWHPAGAYPLFAFIGLDAAAAMAPFDAARRAAVRHAWLATVVLFGGAALLGALLLRLTRRKRESRRSGETYRMATEGSSDGFFILGILRSGAGVLDDFEVVDCNQHGAAFCHQRRDTLIGRRFSGLYRDESFARVMTVLRTAVDSGVFDGELEFQPAGTDEARWMHLKAVRSDDTLAITLRDISESKAHVAALEHRGNHDALTGLPNRHWLQWYLPQALTRARENAQTLALLFIDLDGFKTANDTMGHAAGDELLRHAAHRLKDAVRPHDNVVRIGGDEFVVILENSLRLEDAAIVAKRIIFAFKPKFKLIGGSAVLGTSIGISSFPSDGQDAASLLQNADLAMYSVKTSGKGSFRFFDPEFYEALRRELEHERELRRAIEADEFVIHYQPRMDLASNRTTSMEALVRWMHPARGLLEPKDFIPLAEKTGMIVRLGELVLLKVCEQLQQWVRKEDALVPVSVNISSRQFNETDIARIFSSAMARYGIPSHLLEIELTESSMMGGNRHVLESLSQIRNLGIKLLVDDFGTGYSSLAQLQMLDFDILKVDKAFTSRIEQTDQGKILFTAIITMAHALGMRVVAEGVETRSQLTILRALACDEVQGYFISFPQAAAEVQSALLHQAA